MADFTENDILGFDPSQLSVFSTSEQSQSSGNPLVYKTKPAESVSEDGVYRATIKIIYNPFDVKNSIIEQQSYAIHDEQGWLTVVSSLTVNDRSCPIFTAWKKCHYADPGSMLWKQAALEKDGGKALFDKRFARYVTVQILEDKNHPELEGQYLFWKLPTSIWTLINQKMAPSAESKKAAIPVMDFLFGRSIDIEVTPGPEDKLHPERKLRETSYYGELSEDVVSCTNPDGSPLLNDEDQEVLDTYITQIKKVWKEKDPAVRSEMMQKINQDPNTVKLRTIYRNTLEQIKQFCPNIVEKMSYHEWPDSVKTRVQNWIDKVLAGKDPAQGAENVPAVNLNTVTADTHKTEQTTTVAVETTPDGGIDDLPF